MAQPFLTEATSSNPRSVYDRNHEMQMTEIKDPGIQSPYNWGLSVIPVKYVYNMCKIYVEYMRNIYLIYIIYIEPKQRLKKQHAENHKLRPIWPESQL